MTVCDRIIHNRLYRGISKCHPNDYGFESKLVGEHYAYVRSVIKEMRCKRDELQSQLKVLIHLNSVFEQNEKIAEDELNDRNEAGYLLRKQIHVLERDLNNVRQLIKETKEDLKEQMQKRDELHARLISNRQKQNLISNESIEEKTLDNGPSTC